MSTFTTYNQFDKRFSDFGKFNTDRTACPLFALLSCYNFMLNGDISQKRHEYNIQSAIINYGTKDLPKYMLFEELLLLTNNSLKSQDINATTPELLVSNIVGYEHIFRFGYPKNYCVLLLKNRNFMAILCKVDESGNETYALRDCHEKTQHNFNNFEDMRKFLDNTYQFEQNTIVGGVRIPEFENIEFITIENPFEVINIDTELFDDVISQETQYIEENNQTINNKINNTKISDNLDSHIAFSIMADDGIDDYINFV
jgi:hypothetical protein